MNNHNDFQNGLAAPLFEFVVGLLIIALIPKLILMLFPDKLWIYYFFIVIMILIGWGLVYSWSWGYTLGWFISTILLIISGTFGWIEIISYLIIPAIIVIYRVYTLIKGDING
jgi:hypothetical protein